MGTENTTVVFSRMPWSSDTQRAPRTPPVCSPGCAGGRTSGIFFFDVVEVGGFLVLVGYGDIVFFVKIDFDGRLDRSAGTLSVCLNVDGICDALAQSIMGHVFWSVEMLLVKLLVFGFGSS
jgi:hypothetical protein